jgi:2-oxoglutarate dehydrogenase E2 component (dihydrolipoamide succinyltransferase)
MIEIKMPEAGFSVTEGTVVEWFKAVGDTVREGETVACVETDKVTVDIPAESSGVLKEIRVQKGEVVQTGGVLGTIGESAASVPAAHGAAAGVRATPAPAADSSVQTPAPLKRISPAAKALAREHKIDLSLLSAGSGPEGRIVRQDVVDRLNEMRAASTNGQVPAPAIAASPSRGERLQRVDFTGWRKVIADRMLESARKIPHYTMSVEADVTWLSETIAKLRRQDEALHITYLPFMIKAMCLGIRAVRNLNALADDNGYTIHDEVNVGVAVDLGEKLLVPVVRGAQNKSILEIFHDVDDLVKRARANALSPRDVEGGTITVTNVGMFHTISATSVILPPQVAILYMGAAEDRPAVHEGKIEIRRQMVFGGTYDHRVINGADGGRFLVKIKECLEAPEAMLLELR